MNPPIQMPTASYQQSATPLYPLKPQEVPVMPDNYADGHGSSAGYPPTAGYPPSAPTSDFGGCIASAVELMCMLTFVVWLVLVGSTVKRIFENVVEECALHFTSSLGERVRFNGIALKEMSLIKVSEWSASVSTAWTLLVVNRKGRQHVETYFSYLRKF